MIPIYLRSRSAVVFDGEAPAPTYTNTCSPDIPDVLKVVISGITNPSYTQFNGTWLVPWYAPNNRCEWANWPPETAMPDGTSCIDINFGATIPGTWAWVLYINTFSSYVYGGGIGGSNSNDPRGTWGPGDVSGVGSEVTITVSYP